MGSFNLIIESQNERWAAVKIIKMIKETWMLGISTRLHKNSCWGGLLTVGGGRREAGEERDGKLMRMR